MRQQNDCCITPATSYLQGRINNVLGSWHFPILILMTHCIPSYLLMTLPGPSQKG